VIVVSLLLIDIGHTFNQPVGIAGQLLTAASVISIITAVLMGMLSTRFSHKSLLLLGLTAISVSSIGCFLAFNFSMLFLMFSLSGLGMAVIEPVLFALVGKQYQLKQRSYAISWLYTGVSLSDLLGTPVIGGLAEVGGWRWAFLGFVLPIAFLSIILTTKSVPSFIYDDSSRFKDNPTYWEGYQGVFGNWSALACLIGSIFGTITFQAGFYGPSFFREHYQVSIRFVSMLIIGAGFFFIVGSQICGRLVNRLGRKPLTIVASFFAGIFIIAYLNATAHLWLAVILRFLSSIFFGIMFTASSSLALEQVHEHKGTMMSLTSASWYLGMALGAGIGGFTLLLSNYQVLGLVLGIPSLMAAVIYCCVVKDSSH